MSNGLTGYYDVVVEVEVGAVNRLLATVHQNSASEDASPKFIHSRVARVGSKPALSQFELAETFLQEYFAIGSIDSADISQSILTEVQHNVAAAQAAVRKLGRDLSQAVASPAPSGTADTARTRDTA